MINFKAHAYLIECQSNLHVGSGDNDYGVIDKQVQRDTITMAPVIHASGLKGALREYFDKSVRLDRKKIDAIFGSGKDEKNLLQQGAFRFMEASLLSIPVRGIGNEAFYRGTSEEIIESFNKMAVHFRIQFRIELSASNAGTAQTEYGNAPLLGDFTSSTGGKTIKLDKSMMKDVLTQLPIIARNSLDNGQSENLWYEEVVPRESRFYFFVLVPDNITGDLNYESDFNAHLHEKIVQIGANATVGYGYCKIIKIAEHEQKN